MTVTRLVLLLGVALFGLLCWMAAVGFHDAYELLVSAAVLVVLVGGGNWLGGRRTPDIEPYRPPVAVATSEDPTVPGSSGATAEAATADPSVPEPGAALSPQSPPPATPQSPAAP